MNQALFSYIAACPTAFQAAAHTAALLEAEGVVFTPEGRADLKRCQWQP